MRGIFFSRRFAAFCLTAFLLWQLACPALADTNLKVEFGWGGQMRPQRWTAVLVRASDSRNRNVLLEVYWPQGGPDALRIGENFAIGPSPTTFELLVPVHGFFDYQQAVFTLRDADSGRTLARFPGQLGGWSQESNSVTTDGGVVGVSGRSTDLPSLRANLSASQLAIAYMEPQLLPASAIGYDSLDVLVLNAPNLSPAPSSSGQRAVDADQQQAILDWVRGGGNLILWPRAGEPSPTGGPIVDALPARLGDAASVSLNAEQAARAGLDGAQLTMNSYQLTPQADARRIDLLDGQLIACSRRLGLGTIVLLPIDASRLAFADAAKGRAFWQPLVAGMHVLPPLGSSAAVVTSQDDQMQSDAVARIAQTLSFASAPGFDFRSLIMVLAGMMVIVGPVDWLVLKLLGRRPWTWVTVSGWVLFITLGAITAVNIFKSGEVHYRTLRLIDQVGDSSVASIEYAGISSGHPTSIAVATDPGSWWQPIGAEDVGQPRLAVDVPFHQSDAGNFPEPISISGAPLLLRGQKIEPGPPIIAASLSRQGSADRIVGVIKNLTDRPLKDLHVRSGGKIGTLMLHQEKPASAPAAAPSDGLGAALQQIPPFATVRVEAQLTQVPPSPAQQESRYPTAPTDPNEPLWQTAKKLDIRRQNRIEELLINDDSLVCIEAEVVQPPAAAKVVNQKLAEEHWQFIRAVVELKR
jgi:hypothetical protein